MISFKSFLLKFRLNVFFIFLLKSSVSTAQLFNDTGTLRIMSGSSVVCLRNFMNRGTITNEGKLEVQGNFSNDNIYNSTGQKDSLLLTGSGNITLNTGASSVSNLLVNKINGGGVTLTAKTTIGVMFNLLGGSFSTDPRKPYELIAPASAVFTFTPGAEITGKIRRTEWVNGKFIIFNQAGMAVKTTGGTAPASLLVNMLPGKEPTASENEVKRYFYFDPVGGNGYTADITFPYSPNELNTNTETDLVAWYYDEYNKWKQKLTGNTINTRSHYLTSAGIKAQNLENHEWKIAEVKFENKNESLFVYPIPAKGTLNILLIAEANKKVKIELIDVAGKADKALQKDIQKGINKIAIDIATLSSGQYILKVEEGNTIQTKVVLIN